MSWPETQLCFMIPQRPVTQEQNNKGHFCLFYFKSLTLLGLRSRENVLWNPYQYKMQCTRLPWQCNKSEWATLPRFYNSPPEQWSVSCKKPSTGQSSSQSNSSWKCWHEYFQTPQTQGRIAVVHKCPSKTTFSSSATACCTAAGVPLSNPSARRELQLQ